jgi:hypothetical protein
MKAIETNYKGYRFRSRLEARWAVFFDALGIKWEYEKEGYELPSGWYLPDFWLPDDRLWVEIKGQEPSAIELQLAKELTESTKFGAFVFHGVPLENNGHGFPVEFLNEDDFDVYEWNDVSIKKRWDDGFNYTPGHRVIFISLKWLDDGMPFNGAIPHVNDHETNDIKKLADKAKSARFEHGESPKNIRRR